MSSKLFPVFLADSILYQWAATEVLWEGDCIFFSGKTIISKPKSLFLGKYKLLMSSTKYAHHQNTDYSKGIRR